MQSNNTFLRFGAVLLAFSMAHMPGASAQTSQTGQNSTSGAVIDSPSNTTSGSTASPAAGSTGSTSNTGGTTGMGPSQTDTNSGIGATGSGPSGVVVPSPSPVQTPLLQGTTDQTRPNSTGSQSPGSTTTQ